MINSLIPPSAFVITPDDNRSLSEYAYGVRASGAGTVTYLDGAGTQWTDTVAAGETIIMLIKKVLATGTTATGLRGNRKEF